MQSEPLPMLLPSSPVVVVVVATTTTTAAAATFAMRFWVSINEANGKKNNTQNTRSLYSLHSFIYLHFV